MAGNSAWWVSRNENEIAVFDDYDSGTSDENLLLGPGWRVFGFRDPVLSSHRSSGDNVFGV